MGSGVVADLRQGWAIPTATDIAFSYLVGRWCLAPGHPAIRFLLLLAIADDAGGLLILAVFYPTKALAPDMALLSRRRGGGVYLLFNWLPRYLDRGDQLAAPRRPGCGRSSASVPMRWRVRQAGMRFYRAGIHPALGLIPIIPAIPHADHNFGLYAEAEKYLTRPAEPDRTYAGNSGRGHPVALRLANAGVALSAVDQRPGSVPRAFARQAAWHYHLWLFCRAHSAPWPARRDAHVGLCCAWLRWLVSASPLRCLSPRWPFPAAKCRTPPRWARC